MKWLVPGEDAAMKALVGEKGFLSPARLRMYDSERNNPSKPTALSGASSSLL